MAFVSRYLFQKLINIEPVISKQGDLLVIGSSWRHHVFSLGSASRKITVDPKLQVVRITGRRFWFVANSRRIEFDWIEEILYGFWSSFGGSSGDGFFSGASGGGLWGFGEGTQDEMFTVALQLKNNTKVVLCRFIGSGDFYNNTFLPDWLYMADQMVAESSRGTQETSSHALVDVLSKLIGVPVVNPS